MASQLERDIALLPDKPGVYFFCRGDQILYIGKATSLRDRVRSYFSRDIAETRGPKIVLMLEKANRVRFEKTDSVLEALILESRLIKKHQPEYNTREKDNKSYQYIVITAEDLPRVAQLREREIMKSPEVIGEIPIDSVYGPFPSGPVLREALRILRKIFPFRDRKAGNAVHNRFYRFLGLSPDASTDEARAAYRANIERLKQFLGGKKKTLIRDMERDMKALARDERFEEAAAIRNQMFALQHIQDIALIKDELVQRKGRVSRIEAYDVAHIRGSHSVGVMTVLTDGEPDKAQYRKFKLRGKHNGSDTGALAEVIERRLGHPEWRLPTLIVADGSTAQKRVIEKALREYGYAIPVVAVTKDERHKAREIKGNKKTVADFHNEILLANHEAHRYAIQYHQLLRRQSGIK